MSLYPLYQTIHLVSAVVFGGFIFAEVFLFPSIEKLYGKKHRTEAEYAIVKRGIKIIPVFFLLLLSTGTLMYLRHIHSLDAMFATPFNIALNIKVLLVILTTLGILTAFVLFFTGRADSRLFEWIHYMAFLLVFTIIILAKVMFLI